ncbi:MAG: hypothetical protein ICV73_17200, partial [Acetobacteraceae bacterium]|nr:hypothetical protein [Acetobacteraceae bacterium]
MSRPSGLAFDSAGRSAANSAYTAADIVAEAERRPGHVPHIARPEPPRILHGTTPGNVLEEACGRADRATDRMGRRVKRDAAILVSAVTSYPLTWEAVRADPAGMRRIRGWLRAEKRFWRGEFGDRVRCILLHVDEERPNVHVLLVPELVPTTMRSGRVVQVLDIGTVDPLHRAAREARAAGASFVERRNAARLAGAAFQQRYARDVGAAIGLSAGEGRAGPRLSRFEARVRQEVRRRTAELEAQLAAAAAAARRG